MKKIGIGSLVGFSIGLILACYFAPKGIAWYFEPPVDIGINCRPAVEWGNERLIISQFAGGAFGAVVGAFLNWHFGRKKFQRLE